MLEKKFQVAQSAAICQILGIPADEVCVAVNALKEGGYHLYLAADSAVGSARLDSLIATPDFKLLSRLVIPHRVSIKPSPSKPIFQFEIKKMLIEELTQVLLPVAVASKSSLFLIGYDGHYHAYFDGGHPGPTVVPYSEMIGTRTAEKLPEPMRSVVLHYHDLAIDTSEPQEYIYTSPNTGKPMKSVAIPYPSERVVALLVGEAAPAIVPVPA